jgi:hypothetical protein
MEQESLISVGLLAPATTKSDHPFQQASGRSAGLNAQVKKPSESLRIGMLNPTQQAASPMTWQTAIGMEKKEPFALGLLDGVLGTCSKLPTPPRGMFRDESTTSESADAMAVIVAATIHNRDLDRERPALQVGEEKRKTPCLIEAGNYHAEPEGVSTHRCHELRSARQSMSFFMQS